MKWQARTLAEKCKSFKLALKILEVTIENSSPQDVGAYTQLFEKVEADYIDYCILLEYVEQYGDLDLVEKKIQEIEANLDKKVALTGISKASKLAYLYEVMNIKDRLEEK